MWTWWIGEKYSNIEIYWIGDIIVNIVNKQNDKKI